VPSRRGARPVAATRAVPTRAHCTTNTTAGVGVGRGSSRPMVSGAYHSVGTSACARTQAVVRKTSTGTNR
jgi:hypothetical protein